MMKLELEITEFLKEAAQFELGDLPTEASHPETTRLSQLAQSDLPKAIEVFKRVEIAGLQNITKSVSIIDELSFEIEQCLRREGRIFFCGCGATGRLSISLETNWRESLNDHPGRLKESIIGFIAGGDFALVKSIENFEDHPEYGEKQLIELGFTSRDLLIACTEGGETPFVIGASLKGAEISSSQTYFLFCNPPEALFSIERSKKVFENSRIRSVSLATGPQAICGSTRLQASSMLYLACGLALFKAQSNFLRSEAKNSSPDSIANAVSNYLGFLGESDLTPLARLIEVESQAYLKDEFVTYHLDRDPMPILTDLTERSPTFNLLPVENSTEKLPKAATANLNIDSATDSRDAWFRILLRQPRALSWTELKQKFNERVMLGFDFSASPQNIRNSLIHGKVEHQVRLEFTDSTLIFKLKDQTLASLALPGDILSRNLFLKLIFNLVSTLAQCQNGRVLGNIMLFVKPSNKKLIDRAARFTKIILKNQHGVEASYAEVIGCVFASSKNLKPEESVVLKSVDFYLKKFAKALT